MGNSWRSCKEDTVIVGVREDLVERLTVRSMFMDSRSDRKKEDNM